jgi:hypothetical protein
VTGEKMMSNELWLVTTPERATVILEMMAQWGREVQEYEGKSER